MTWDGVYRDDRDVLTEFSAWLDEKVAEAKSRLPINGGDGNELNAFAVFHAVQSKLTELWPD